MTKKKKHQHRKTANTKQQRQKPGTWVDRVGVWEPCEEERCSSSASSTVAVVSWNVLAESYLTKRSHQGLPQKYQSVVFDRKKRRSLLRKTLRKLSIETDVFCLQEVDLPDVKEELSELGFTGVATPTTKGGGGGRVDSCVIMYRHRDWELRMHQVVQLDDLAGRTVSTDSPLHGLQASFLRRNTAIFAKLQKRRASGETIVVANTHLYWHPGYEYVKLSQAHYIQQRLQEFSETFPVILCGDFNSKPDSTVHRYLTKGSASARSVAPWYWHHQDDDVDENEFPPRGSLTTGARDKAEDQIVLGGDETRKGNVTEEDDDETKEAQDVVDTNASTDEMDELMKSCSLQHNVNESSNRKKDVSNRSSPRYLCDYTLNRFCRWLRILGIDTALETEEEEQLRTKQSGPTVLFNRCREEHRTLLTTSKRLVLRKECPPGTYLINSRSTADLEAAFVQLLVTHGVVLEPSTFLSRCVVCNGNIVEVEDDIEQKRLFATIQVPDLSAQLLNVYACDGCSQPYWWSEEPSSSATRVKLQAAKLFKLCLRAGVPVTGELDMFEFVNVEEEREKGIQENEVMDQMEVIDWLKDENLSHPFHFHSAYAMHDERGSVIGEKLPFTNVTHDFVDTLDYVFFDSRQFSLHSTLWLPLSFKSLNGDARLHNGHLLPSNVWPSDHLAIGARLSLSLDGAAQQRLDHASLNGEKKATEHASREETGDIQKSSIQIKHVDTQEQVDNPVNDAPSTSGNSPNGVASDQSGMSAAAPLCGEVGEGAAPTSFPVPTFHGKRCACGCVPQIYSLFEMAELRRQAKLKAQQKQTSM